MSNETQVLTRPGRVRGMAGSVVMALRAAARPGHRWLLAAVLALAACLNFYALGASGYPNLYYAAAIRSMLQSWHNFFFVAFDPAGFVSVDKPPLGFWVQVASAKIFGFSAFSVLLPEALAGVLAVAVLYLIVRRVFGRPAALLAAFFLALTPVSVVTNRNNTIDSLLVLTVLLAAYAITRAVEAGSLRWLLLAAALVGLGFNIKMLQAYLVVPAFGLMYLLAAPRTWWTRLWHLATAGAAMLAISLSWVLAVDLTPASQRPYVGSSSTNSALELALGYNGVQRLLGAFFQRPRANVSAPAGGIFNNGAAGPLRLLDVQLGGQVSWLLVLGLVGVLATGWGLWRAVPVAAWRQAARGWRGWGTAHLSARPAALVLWGMWTLTQAIFFSVAEFFHPYYLVMLAPGIAALAGIGTVLLWQDFVAPGWHGWLLPIALALTALAQVAILAPFPDWSTRLAPLMLGGTAVCVVVLVAARVALVATPRRGEHDAPMARASRWLTDSQRWHTLAPVATVLALAVLLIGPATWVGISLAQGGNGALPSAGPSAPRVAFAGGVPPSGALPPGALPFRPGGLPRTGQGAPRADGAPRGDAALIGYLEANRGGATYLFATLNAQSAAPYILQTGLPVLTLGGFSGSDPILTVGALQALVRGGQVRYFLLGGGGFGGPGGGGNAQLVQWVTTQCRQVPAQAVGGGTVFGAGLYDCA